MSNERSGFSSRLGFVLATAGSAVGLGNIWRFPYLAAKYGGGTFLLTYLILTLTFGFSLMITEVALGRKAGTSAIRAFGHFSKKHTFIGYLTTIIPFIIFPYYCVIGGWVTKYALISLQGGIHNAASDTFFTGFISKSAEPMICVLVFIHADHNSGVGSSAYKYLLPVCDVIYGEPSIANVLQDNHILSQSFGHG